MRTETSSGRLSKTRFVLDFFGGEGDEMTFVRKRDPDDEPQSHRVQRLPIPRQLYDELGQPEQITVTIEPGDQLNQEEVT